MSSNVSYNDKYSQVPQVKKTNFLKHALALKRTGEGKSKDSKPNYSKVHNKENKNKDKFLDTLFSLESADMDKVISEEVITQLMYVESTRPLKFNFDSKIKHVKPFVAKGKLLWREMHWMYFHPDCKALDKKITLSFIKIENQNEAISIGKERTFFLSQFDSTKIYDFDIKFQKHFESHDYASLNVKIQYIK